MSSERPPLADVLGRYMSAKGRSFEKLAEETGLPRNTVYRWLNGDVSKPHRWQPVATVAGALGLTKAQTNTLLLSAQHPPIEELLDRVRSDEDKALLSRWIVTVPNNLPGQMTSFVGREEEIARVVQRMSEARLVTLTGTGGSGKTRLALEAAGAALDDFEDGVYFVGLAPIQEGALVIPAISRVLDTRESVGQPPIEALKAHLRDKRVLLLLDNFEQVLDTAPVLIELLVAAPRVKALVTSRTWLHVSGEHEFPVQPLPLPNSGDGFEVLKANPAVALFAERARAVRSDFVVTRENAPLVAEICARLDGLPLAIELAAARTRRFTLSELLDRFPSRLDLGGDGPRDADQRHRSLRCMISWSYDLLRPDEQPLFRRLAVFAGGSPEDAVMEVSRRSGDIGLDVPAAVDTLIENNLLRQTSGIDDERRFAMLETIREYALERLGESGELEATQRAHADYYLRLAEIAEPEWDGPRRTYWLDRLELELPNFRAALQWCAERGDVVSGLRLSTALMALWQVHDHHTEGRGWLETFTIRDHGVSPDLRAKALLWQGLLLMRYAGDLAAAEPLFGQALVVYSEIGDLSGACQTVQAQGDAAFKRQNFATARARYMESLDLAEQAGDDYLAARSCLKIAVCAQEDGDFASARHPWERSLALARAAGVPARIASALNGLGEVARSQRDLETARCYYQQGLELAQETGSEWGIAMSLHNLGYVASYAGQHEQASALFIESLMLHEKRQVRQGIGECLAGLAYVAACQGHAERAARLSGAAAAVLESISGRLDLLERTDYEETLRTVRSLLPDERFEALLAEGRAMSLERAVKFATMA